MEPLDIIILILHFRPPLPPTIQRIKTNLIFISPSIHRQPLPPAFIVLQEFAELLLADLDCLGRCGVGHAEHGAPEVEAVGDVGADGEDDEEDEVDWVAEHCGS